MKLPYLLIAALILLDGFVWQEIAAGRTSAAMYFLDVGQGDGELVRFGNGSKLLTDAGPDDRVDAALAGVLPDTDRYIDLGIITHAQLDHYGGFLALLGRYEFGAILWNGREPDETSEHWERLKAEIAARHIPLVTVAAGDRIRFGSGDRVDVLSPTPDLWASTELNDGCIVTKIRQAGTSALFTCDAGYLVEQHLLESGADIRADILKVGHHGSRYASNDLFLRTVRPAVAAIEVGARNTYGHPGTETLARLASSTGAKVFRTDRNGTITVSAENGKLRVFTER